MCGPRWLQVSLPRWFLLITLSPSTLTPISCTSRSLFLHGVCWAIAFLPTLPRLSHDPWAGRLELSFQSWTNSPGSGIRVFKCYLCLAHLPLKPSLPGSDVPSGLDVPFPPGPWEETGPAGCRNSHFRARKGDKRQNSEPCREEADMFLMIFVTHSVAYVEDLQLGMSLVP